MEKSFRRQLLENAIKHTCGNRDLEYGSPFENLGNIADLWTTYIISKYRGKEIDELRFRLTAEDVAHLNVLMKMARTFSGNIKSDTYEDQAAYSAIAGECASMQADLSFTAYDGEFNDNEIAAMFERPESRT